MTTGRINQVTTFCPSDRVLADEGQDLQSVARYQGEDLPSSPTMELVDLSWVASQIAASRCFHGLDLPISRNMEASKLTCLVSQSRKFQACFALSP
jgi:hypothetical protein